MPSPVATTPTVEASPDFVARLIPLDPGFYAFSLRADTEWREPIVGLALPAVQVSSPPDRGAIEITDSFGRAGTWLGGRHKMLFVKAPAEGGAALVTAYLARDPDAVPLELEIRRVDPSETAAHRAGSASTAPLPPLLRLQMDRPAAPGPARPATIDIVAHIRGRGDVRFVDVPWVGRLGPGMWIEAFVILSRNRSVSGAIEYKGLTASGAETPWLACGMACGTTGKGLPLTGFAIRQKAVPGGAQLDCEYSGYFQSGATVGPVRNGAPCRSPNDDDPLEGMQVSLTPRPARRAAAEPR